MSVILEPDHYEDWLTSTDPAALQTMLQPFPAQLMAAYPVSTKVNSVKNDTPDVVEPVAATGGQLAPGGWQEKPCRMGCARQGSPGRVVDAFSWGR